MDRKSRKNKNVREELEDYWTRFQEVLLSIGPAAPV